MITVRSFHARLRFELDRLPEFEPPLGFRPLLAPTGNRFESFLSVLDSDLRRRISKDLDFDSGNAQLLVAAELYADDDSLVVMTLNHFGPLGPLERATLGITYIGSLVKLTSVEEFKRRTTEQVAADFRPYYRPSDRYDQLRNELCPMDSMPTKEEQAAAFLLSDRQTRVLATAIKAFGSLLLSDVPRRLPDVDLSLTAKLRSANLLSLDVVVICSKTQTETIRVPSRAALEDAARRDLKCACGRPISEERSAEALTVTPFCRQILDKSRWLTILVVNALLELGVPLKHIFVEQRLGGDEVDCIAVVGGVLIMFELKDKEFNLGNAYSFGAKFGVVRPNRAVIISTERVGADARQHFDRTCAAAKSAGRRYTHNPAEEILYVEGIGGIVPALEQLVGELMHQNAVSIVGEVLSLATPSPESIVAAVAKRSD